MPTYTQPQPIRAEVNADRSASFLARITGLTNERLTQAAITSIALTITDQLTGLVVPGFSALAVLKTAVIFDTLQTVSNDPAWQGPGTDTTGYNFRYICPTTAFPDDGREYEVEFVFTLVATATDGVTAQQVEQTFIVESK